MALPGSRVDKLYTYHHHHQHHHHHRHDVIIIIIIIIIITIYLSIYLTFFNLPRPTAATTA